MRIRTIKPEFWRDKKVASWSVDTRLVFIGLWCAADDHGVGCAEPERIAADLFPYDLSRDSRDTLARVSEGLGKLSEASVIDIYEARGELWYSVRNWSRHQRVDKPGRRINPTIEEGKPIDSRDSRDTLATLSRPEQGTGNREQGTGKREQEGVRGNAGDSGSAADASPLTFHADENPPSTGDVATIIPTDTQKPRKSQAKGQGEAIQLPYQSEKFTEAWEGYAEMRRKIKKPLTDRARKLVLSELTEWGEDRAIAMLNRSSVNSWAGVFPEKDWRKDDRIIKAAPINYSHEAYMSATAPKCHD